MFDVLPGMNARYSILAEHCVGDVVSRHRCRLVSQSDSFTPSAAPYWASCGNSPPPLAENECVFTNRVVVSSTADQAVAEGQAALERHSKLETPLYAVAGSQRRDERVSR